MRTSVTINFPPSKNKGFTLVEVVISLAILGVCIGGIVYGYVLAANRAEWAAHSLAAQNMAFRVLEQTRAASWNPTDGVDEVTTVFYTNHVRNLDLPTTKTYATAATNFVTIALVSTNPPLKMIQVDCVWSFRDRGPFTNTATTYRSPTL